MRRKRRTFSADFKAKVVIEAIKEIKTISELSQAYHIHPNLISVWKNEFVANAGKVFEAGKNEAEEVQKLQKENDELIHQVGRLTMDINWLKKKCFDSPGNT